MIIFVFVFEFLITHILNCLTVLLLLVDATMSAVDLSNGFVAEMKTTYWAKLSDREKAFPHKEQTYGRSWVCVRTCLLESVCWLILQPNSSHEVGGVG
jgi:hypothetical protein